MYKEQLDNATARAILGEDYVEGLHYNLLSDRDKFVVTGYDDAGVQCVENSLQQDRQDDFVETDEPAILPMQKHSFPIGTLITVLLCVACIAAVTVVGILMCKVR